MNFGTSREPNGEGMVALARVSMCCLRHEFLRVMNFGTTCEPNGEGVVAVAGVSKDARLGMVKSVKL